MRSFFFILCLSSAFFLNAQTIETVAGNGNCCGGVDSIPAISSALYYPRGVAVSAGGDMFIAEGNKIRRVDPSGIIYTYAGSFGGYSGDGGPATSALLEPSAVTTDAVGNVYVADQFNCVVRKINTAGIISTIAGTGVNGSGGDGGPAVNAHLNSPGGVAVSPAGIIYIADSNNHRIRKISPSGIISTVAGTGVDGFSGDGGSAVLAKLGGPVGITFDAAGNLYIADLHNHRIRKVNTAGVISTIAGTGAPGFSGDGGNALLAQLNGPSSVAIDSDGNLYIGDSNNLRVRMIKSADGTIQTVTGGVYGYSGDGGPAINAQIGSCWGICTDAVGNVYIADQNTKYIRRISSIVGIAEQGKREAPFQVYPNPTTGTFRLKTGLPEKKSLAVYDLKGMLVYSGYVDAESPVDLTFLSAGIYTVTVKGDRFLSTEKLVIIK